MKSVKQKATIDGYFREMMIEGGCFSSQLWNLIMDGLQELPTKNNFQAQDYADDELVTNRFISIMCERK